MNVGAVAFQFGCSGNGEDYLEETLPFFLGWGQKAGEERDILSPYGDRRGCLGDWSWGSWE